MNELDWIESGGGPLMLMQEALASDWRGVKTSSLSHSATDYQRACDVQDEIGVIAVGSGQAVVLGDEPDRTAVLLEDGNLLILRWRWAESEGELLSTMRDGLEDVRFTESGRFSTKAGRHLLFDSAYAGSEIAQSLAVELGANEFLLETAYFEPTKSVSALIHRLRAIVPS